MPPKPKCDCHERPVSGKDQAYFVCNLCKKAICIRCLKVDDSEKDIEDEDNREHAFCILSEDEDEDSSCSESNKSKDKETEVIQETPRRKARVDNEQSDNTDDLNQSPSVSKSTSDPLKTPKARGKRSQPDNLKKAVRANKDRVEAGFDVKKELDMKASHRPSYTATNRVMTTCAEKAAVNFCRILKTKSEFPETKHDVSFQIKAKVTNNAGKSSYHLFEIGDTTDFEKEVNYKNISVPSYINNQVKNLKKETLNKTKKTVEKKTSKTASKVKKVKNNSKHESEQKDDMDEDDSPKKTKEKKTLDKKRKTKQAPEYIETSENESEDIDEEPKRKRNRITPPIVNITPSTPKNAIRSPFNVSSGQGQSVKQPPPKKTISNKHKEKSQKAKPKKKTITASTSSDIEEAIEQVSPASENPVGAGSGSDMTSAAGPAAGPSRIVPPTKRKKKTVTSDIEEASEQANPASDNPASSGSGSGAKVVAGAGAAASKVADPGPGPSQTTKPVKTLGVKRTRGRPKKN